LSFDIQSALLQVLLLREAALTADRNAPIRTGVASRHRCDISSIEAASGRLGSRLPFVPKIRANSGVV
jgi:hypothetical protein